MKTILITVALAVIIGTNIGLVSSDDAPAYTPSVHQIMVKDATFYTAPLDQLMVVGKCESGFRQSAIGKAGEIGTFQYFQSTWDGMSKAMGETLDINSQSDQIKLTAWVFANHPEWKTQWSTWKVWYGLGLKRCTIQVPKK